MLSVCFLPDDIIQLVYFELNDPTNLILCSKRYYKLSQDPYVRARYFLARYGNVKAMFMALGRGKLMTIEVIDVSNPDPFSPYMTP
jgi:hypothetical protein